MIDLVADSPDELPCLLGVLRHLPEARLVAATPASLTALDGHGATYRLRPSPDALVAVTCGASERLARREYAGALRVRLHRGEGFESLRQRAQVHPFDALLVPTEAHAFLARRFAPAHAVGYTAEGEGGRHAAERLRALARQQLRLHGFRSGGAQLSNVIWICIDGVRPDRLHSCGNRGRPELYLDQLLSRGVLFSQVYSAAAGTHTATHSAFTSMYLRSHGVEGWTRDAMWRMNPRALSLTDFLARAGYRTFRWCDCAGEQVSPKSGFEVWEDSGLPVGVCLAAFGDELDSPRRARFFERFAHTPGPKFAYIHLEMFHELNGRMGRCWTTEGYDASLAPVAESMRKLVQRLGVVDDDLLLVTTDHGAKLDEDYEAYERRLGPRHEEAASLTFASFIRGDLEARRVPGLARSIDLAPTILDLLGLGDMGAEGRSLLPVLLGAEHVPLWAFREKGAAFDIPPSPDVSNLWCVRADPWKLVLHAKRADSNWLMDLREGDYARNQLGGGQAVEAELRRAIDETLREGAPSPVELYAESGQLLRPEDFDPEVSILLPVCGDSPELGRCLRSLCAQAGTRVEIAVLDGSPGSETALGVAAEFRDHPQVRLERLPGRSLRARLQRGLERARGPYIALADADMCYEETALANLIAALESRPGARLACGDWVGRDPNSGGERFALASALQPECALFRRRAAREMGGFREEEEPAARLLDQLARSDALAFTQTPCAYADRAATARVAPGVKVSLITTAESARLLESLGGQTYRDFEVVVTGRDANPVAALNYGIRAARGRLLGWVDPDMRLEPGWLEALVAALDGCPGAGLAHAAFARVDSSGALRSICHQPHGRLHIALTERPQVAGLLYRRELHESIGLCNTDLGEEAEWDFLVRALEVARAVSVPEVLCQVPERGAPATSAVLRRAVARRPEALSVEALYPWIDECKDAERARGHACIDFGSRLLRLADDVRDWAIGFLELALRVDPTHPVAAVNLVQAYTLERRWQQASNLAAQLQRVDVPPIRELAERALCASQQRRADLLGPLRVFPLDPASSELLSIEPRH